MGQGIFMTICISLVVHTCSRRGENQPSQSGMRRMANCLVTGTQGTTKNTRIHHCSSPMAACLQQIVARITKNSVHPWFSCFYLSCVSRLMEMMRTIASTRYPSSSAVSPVVGIPSYFLILTTKPLHYPIQKLITTIGPLCMA